MATEDDFGALDPLGAPGDGEEDAGGRGKDATRAAEVGVPEGGSAAEGEAAPAPLSDEYSRAADARVADDAMSEEPFIGPLTEQVAVDVAQFETMLDARPLTPEQKAQVDAAVKEAISDEEPPEPPSVRRTREKRARILAEGAKAQAEIDSWPESSAWKSFVRIEAERQRKMEPLRAAFIKAQGKK